MGEVLLFLGNESVSLWCVCEIKFFPLKIGCAVLFCDCKDVDDKPTLKKTVSRWKK